jgi:hypothetical protein
MTTSAEQARGEGHPNPNGQKRGPKPRGLSDKHRYIRLPAELDHRTEAFARSQGCRIVDVVRTAVANYLDDQAAMEVPLGSNN